MRGIVGNSIIE